MGRDSRHLSCVSVGFSWTLPCLALLFVSFLLLKKRASFRPHPASSEGDGVATYRAHRWSDLRTKGPEIG